MTWFKGLRRFVRDDAADAMRSERETIQRAVAQPLVHPTFHTAMLDASRRAQGIAIGHAAHDPSLNVSLSTEEVLGDGHALVRGGSGLGKTRLVSGILSELVRRFALSPGSLGVALVDHKGEMAEFVRLLLADLLQVLPDDAAEELLSRVAVIDPFSTRALVPLQILLPDPRTRPEEQAFELAALIGRVSGDTGVRQDDFLYHLMCFAIFERLTLPALYELVRDPEGLTTRAARSPSGDVRRYFSGKTKLTQNSFEGVCARLFRLLRLPQMRLMLDADRRIDLHQVLATKFLIIDVGHPPRGSEDLAHFFSELLNLELTNAIFTRSHGEANRPVVIFIDEWQVGLAAGPGVAEKYERLLAEARSRGVRLWLISQSLAGAQKVSPVLPDIVATNTALQVYFGMSQADARHAIHLLPLTGRRRRPRPAPWEEKARSPFLTPDEERRVLEDQLVRLPARHFYLFDRRRDAPAELVVSKAVNAGAGWRRASTAVREQLELGVLTTPIEELERKRDMRAMVFREAKPKTETLFGPTTRPKQRP